MSSSDGKVFKEQLQIGDSSFIDMFGFKLAHGNPRSPFDNDGIVLSESIARKYYGRTDVLGETLILQTNAGKEVTFQITGVLKDMPSNSVVNFAGNPTANEIFLPMSSLKYFMQGADQDWGFKYMVSLIKVAEGVTPADLQKPLAQIVASNAPPEFKNSLKCELKPLANYYLQWGNERVLKDDSDVVSVSHFYSAARRSKFCDHHDLKFDASPQGNRTKKTFWWCTAAAYNTISHRKYLDILDRNGSIICALYTIASSLPGFAR